MLAAKRDADGQHLCVGFRIKMCNTIVLSRLKNDTFGSRVENVKGSRVLDITLLNTERFQILSRGDQLHIEHAVNMHFFAAVLHVCAVLTHVSP